MPSSQVLAAALDTRAEDEDKGILVSLAEWNETSYEHRLVIDDTQRVEKLMLDALV